MQTITEISYLTKTKKVYTALLKGINHRKGQCAHLLKMECGIVPFVTLIAFQDSQMVEKLVPVELFYFGSLKFS